ncbi:hypothetical protein AVEN_43356-1 [Araneus ventricosus]|uniref:Uncharacterized protein n=1 Tax=Araneus ventricosus TaxID=182803 RepID=A0A4Y2FK38_ARAVE|nr:hypothetical protein AVEN_43356-1 [Araneus ventricosus]
MFLSICQPVYLAKCLLLKLFDGYSEPDLVILNRGRMTGTSESHLLLNFLTTSGPSNDPTNLTYTSPEYMVDHQSDGVLNFEPSSPEGDTLSSGLRMKGKHRILWQRNQFRSCLSRKVFHNYEKKSQITVIDILENCPAAEHGML